MVKNTAPLKQTSDTYGSDCLPLAEWLTNPSTWDKTRFINETTEFIFSLHDVGCEYDRHLVAMLADQVELYVICSKNIEADSILISQNDGKTVGANPAASLREKTLIRIVALMGELGITPKTRLAAGRLKPKGELAAFLRGPFG